MSKRGREKENSQPATSLPAQGGKSCGSTAKRVDSKETQEIALACALAKKLVGHNRSSMRANLLKRAHERLQVHRSQEIKQRKLWRRAEEDLGEQNCELSNRLAKQQQRQNAVYLRLKQFQGLDLNSLRICELSEMQAIIEKLISEALQTLESEHVAVLETTECKN